MQIAINRSTSDTPQYPEKCHSQFEAKLLEIRREDGRGRRTLGSGSASNRSSPGKAPASRTAETPASTPQAKLPRTAADWTRMLGSEVEERIEATWGTTPSLMKES